MKKISIIAVLLLLFQVAIGQVNFSYDASGNRILRNATNAPTYSLSISSQTGLTNVGAAGGSNLGNFVVSSTNVNWNISGVSSWATVSTSSGGNGNATINVSFTANSSTSPRSATLTISGDNGVSNQNVTISQVGAGSNNLSISPGSWSPSSSANSTSITVTSNVAWSASSNASWLTVNAPTSGTNNGSLSLSVSANTATSSRSGSVTVSGGGITQTISVSQAGTSGGGGCTVNKVRLIFRKWNIFPCCTERLIGAKILGQNADDSWSDLYTFNFNATNNWEEHTFTGGTFKAVKFQSGLNSSGEVDELEFYNGSTKLSGTAFGVGNYYNNVFDGIEDNGSIGTQWSGSSNGSQNYVGITLSGCGGGPTNNLSVSPGSWSPSSSANSTSITVTSNVAWSASSNVGWLTVNPSSGTNNGSLSLSVSANTATSSRSGSITVSGGGITQTISVSQAGTSGGGGCTVNKVRLIFRKWNIFPCCTERLIGAKILGQNADDSWSDLYTFNFNATNNWEEHTFTGGTFKAVKFQSGPNSSGEVDELEFYNGSTKLSGTAFGVGNYYNNVFDGIEDNGSIGTQWSGSSNGSQNYVGITLSGCGGGPTNNLSVSPGSWSPSSSANSTSITVTSNVAWSASSNVGWLTVNPSSGTNNGSLSLSVSANTATSSRSGSITVSGGGITQTISVSQAGTSGGGGCTVNKVRLIFRKWNIFPCCTERLIGAKILGQNADDSWSDLYTFNFNATNNWEEHTFTGGTFKAVKFQSGPNSSGEVDELEFYNGSTKLSGTAFGVGNYYNNVFDGIEDNGSIGTQWSGSSNGSQNYVGLNLNGCGGTGARMAAANMQEEFETNDFGTDPNPSSGKVMVKFSGQTGSIGSLVVHDMMGKTLVTDSIEANVGKLIELPNHFTGISLFTLTTDTFIKTKKVMIVK